MVDNTGEMAKGHPASEVKPAKIPKSPLSESKAKSSSEPPAKIGLSPSIEPDTETLKKEYLRLARFARKVEDESLVEALRPRLSEIQDKLKSQGVDIGEFPEQAMEKLSPDELRRGPGTMPPVGSFPDLPYTGNPTLDTIVDQLNSIPSEQRMSTDFERQLGRIERIVDEGRVPRDQAREILEGLEGWRTLAANEQAARRGRLERADPRRYFSEQELEIIRTDPVAREKMFNDIFKRADSSPNRPFEEVFSQFYDLPIYTAFIDYLQTAGLGLENEAKKYMEEYDMRRTVHNANYAVATGIGTEQLVNFLQAFRSELADLAFSKKGVVAAMHFYEQALLKVREENGGYLPNEEVIGDSTTGTPGRVEILARKYLNDALTQGLIPGMEEWEKNRAIAFARGMGIITGTTIEIAASSILPEKIRINPRTGKREAETVRDRFVSLYAQDIISNIAPFRHNVMRFDIGKEKNRFLAFLLKRGGAPWTKSELQAFKWDKMIDVINGLVGDEEERYLGVLNPFKVGGILSRTTWRYGDEESVVSALGPFLRRNPENKKWIGTGLWIEKERGNLGKTNEKDDRLTEEEIEEIRVDYNVDVTTKGARAKTIIKYNLQKIARIEPLVIFFNMKDVQNRVITELAGIYGRPVTMQDQQLRDDLDRLVLIQEKAIQDRVDVLDFTLIQDIAQRDRIDRIAGIIRRQFDSEPVLEDFIKNLKDKEWRLPFILGTADLPWNELDFSKIGETGIARRWRDIGSEKKAVDGLNELIDKMAAFKKPEEVTEVLHKIYSGITGYDADIAREVILKLSEGIMKFYGKDWFARLPLGIGTAVGTITKKTSYAQAAFGGGAMAWSEPELNEFSRLIRDAHLITEDQQHKLQAKAGGGKKEVAYALIRTIAPLILLALLYYMFKKTTENR